MWWWGRRGQRRDRWQSVADAGKPTSLAGGDLPVRLGMLERLTRGLLHDFLPENWGHTVSLRCDRGSGWVTRGTRLLLTHCRLWVESRGKVGVGLAAGPVGNRVTPRRRPAPALVGMGPAAAWRERG
jgi:hypothetical protein